MLIILILCLFNSHQYVNTVDIRKDEDYLKNSIGSMSLFSISQLIYIYEYLDYEDILAGVMKKKDDLTKSKYIENPIEINL
jgi:hypothetical protein